MATLGKEVSPMGRDGVPEMLVVFAIALFIFGPKKRLSLVAASNSSKCTS
jgi:hypothetical protein